MTKRQFAKVALPVPLRRLFDYIVPQRLCHSIQVGGRVRVPFGQRRLVGIVHSLEDTTHTPVKKLKDILEVVDDKTLLPANVWQLAHWVSDYYHAPLGEVFQTILPTMIRQGKPLQDSVMIWQLTEKGKTTPPQTLNRSPKQKALFEQIHNAAMGLTAEACKDLGFSKSILRELEQKELLTTSETPKTVRLSNPADVTFKSHCVLNEAQRNACGAITKALGSFQPFVLNGVTGSGKTEVYLNVVAEALAKGKQALIMVPEIGLTPQTIERFQSRFDCKIGAYHSCMTDKARFETWRQVANQELAVVIGTRSSVFLPFHNLGVIIVDEEHDASYKQQEGIRYSARDIAVVRAKMLSAPVVLASATPSLETFYNIGNKHFTRLDLPKRAGFAQMPQVSLVDLRQEKTHFGLSEAVMAQVDATLKRDEQVLFFLNRRGFAPLLMCHDCGAVEQCKRCDARLILHQTPPKLRCHHCNFEKTVPVACSECGAHALSSIGLGTQKLETFLKEAFPKTNILRVDRDTTRTKDSLSSLLDDAKTGKANLLIGTQMLTKGHHFPGVTCVVIVDSDYGLFSPDFKALERMGQMITQVAGRAGREDKIGQVWIQTHNPEHPLLLKLIQQGYEPFVQALSAERESAHLPPYSHLCLVRAQAFELSKAFDFLRRFKELMVPFSGQGFACLGPVPALMEKRAGKSRAQLLLQSRHRATLHQALGAVLSEVDNEPIARQLRWSIDIDPIDMY